MNARLFDSFKTLNDVSKAEIRQKLKDSPLGLKLFQFLDSTKNRNFRNSEVVQFIYAGGKNTPGYATLENRYFKLRKKFLEEYFTEEVEKDEFLAEEELELLRIRKLINGNDKDAALHALHALEEQCWQKNIFELLPQVLDNLIFCRQLLNKLDPGDDVYSRMQKATTLQAATYRMIALARKVYEINYRKGISQAKKELAEMKELARKHKEYPRFAMCYHHVSLYYKLGSSDYIEDMQVISRHFREVKQAFSLYARMPLVVYRRNYHLYQQMHYRQMIMFYHYNRCEFEEAMLVMREFWDNVFQRPQTYSIYKSEALYFNMLNCQRAAMRFTEAEQTLQEYSKFLKENKNTSRLAYAYTLRAMLFADAYPALKNIQPSVLIEKVDEYLRDVKNNSNVQTSFGDALITRARLLFITGQYTEAFQSVKKPEAESFLEGIELKDSFKRFLSVYSLAANHEEVRKQISKQLAVSKNPQAVLHLRWMLRMLNTVRPKVADR